MTAEPSYSIELLRDDDAIANAIEASAGAVFTAFQDPRWLKPVYAHLARAHNAEPLGVVVRECNGRLAMMLPLAITRENGLAVARFPSFGVSDYGAPVLGPSAPRNPEAVNEAWHAIRTALKSVDYLSLENMPRDIADQSNPLDALPCRIRSRHISNVVTIRGTVEEFLQTRGKKYRKEVERCFRLLAKEGPHQFRAVQNSEDIGRAYAALEDQQEARHARSSGYRLDQPAYSAFYKALLTECADNAFAHLFTLEVRGDIVATLFGVTEGKCFTLLRISNGGERWRHLSPGRLIVVETMKYFVTRGVRTFDMGIGDYAFKRGFGAVSQELFDVNEALTLKAKPRASLSRLRASLRDNPHLTGLIHRLKGRH